MSRSPHPALTALLRHGGSVARWAEADAALRERLLAAGRASAVLDETPAWAGLLQSPLGGAGAAIDDLVAALARDDVGDDGDPAQEPRRGVPRAAIAETAGAARGAGRAVPTPSKSGAAGPAAPPPRPARAAARGASLPALAGTRRPGANEAAAVWQQRASAAGLAAAFESPLLAAAAAAPAAGVEPVRVPGWTDAISAAVAARRPAAPPASGLGRIGDVLERIGAVAVPRPAGSGPAGVAAAVVAAGAEPVRAPAPMTPRKPLAAAWPPPPASNPLAAAAANVPLPVRRGGLRGLAESVARAAAPSAALPADDSPAAAPPRPDAGNDATASMSSPPSDEDLADQLARILRRAAERDGIDLDDIQP